ncbi:MAG: E3 binding domain-containing protein, partial [Acidobacteria bacterium]|nr:E3 binding domain-containing protein [Acidobacteriota bacterium]
MSTEVVMPQMGESIAEGTITRWLKGIGERVERDEPLFEISTDKVDAEIPSPAAGTLAEIKFKEGETVEVNTVVAIIGDGDGAGASAPAAASAEAPKAEAAPAAQAAVASEPPPAPPAVVQSAPPAQPPPPPVAAIASGSDDERQRSGAQENGRAVSAGVETKTGEPTVEDLRRTKSSPLVRNIAKEHGIDIAQLEGTGMSGRVTKNDIMSFIESGGTAAAPVTARTPAPPAPVQAPPPSLPALPPAPPGAGDRVEPMSVMRKKIAEHMVLSRRTSAHVTTVYEIDMTRIARLRDKHKSEFKQRVGTKLT